RKDQCQDAEAEGQAEESGGVLVLLVGAQTSGLLPSPENSLQDQEGTDQQVGNDGGEHRRIAFWLALKPRLSAVAPARSPGRTDRGRGSRRRCRPGRSGHSARSHLAAIRKERTPPAAGSQRSGPTGAPATSSPPTAPPHRRSVGRRGPAPGR